MGPTQIVLCIILITFPMVLATCSRSDKRSVCTQEGLTKIPTNLGQDIVGLDVSQNNIQKLDEVTLKLYPKIEHLNISYNKFESENDLEAISALKQLKSVDLSGNPLNTFGLGIFSGNTKLEEIIFENVTSVFIKSKSTHLRKLKKISFKYSSLQYFPIEALSKARKLEVIDLSYTNITSLPDSICNVFPKLQKIIVKNTHIKHLPPCLQAISEGHLHSSETSTKNDEGNDETNFKQNVHKMNQTGLINSDSQNNDGEAKSISHGSFKNVSPPYTFSKLFKSKAKVIINFNQSALVNILDSKDAMYNTPVIIGLLILIFATLGLLVTIAFICWSYTKSKKNETEKNRKYGQVNYLLETV